MATQITTKGILTINGKQVEETFNGLRRAASQLERDLKKLPVGSEEFVKKSEELKKVKARFAEVQAEIKGTNKKMQESGTQMDFLGSKFGILGKALDGAMSKFQGFGGMFSKTTDLLGKGGLSFKALGGVIKVFAIESWAAISSIPIVGWIGAAISAMALLAKQFFDYNNEIYKYKKLIENKFGDLGSAADELRVKIMAVSEQFGVSFERIIDTVDTLSSSGLTSQLGAIDAIIKGIGTTDNVDNFLRKLDLGASKARQIGINLNEVLNLTKALQGTAIDPTQIYGAIEKASVRLQMSMDDNKAMIEAFGKDFTEGLLKEVQSGSITTVEALAKIDEQGKKNNITISQEAALGKDLFGKMAANAGAYEEELRLIGEAHKDQYSDLTELQKETIELTEANIELGKAKDDALKSDALLRFEHTVELAWTKIKTYFYKGVGYIIAALTNIKVQVLLVPKAMGAAAKGMKGIFTGIVSDIKDVAHAAYALLEVLDGLVHFNVSDTKKAWNNLTHIFDNGFKHTKEAFSGAKNSFVGVFTDSFQEIKDAFSANQTLYKEQSQQQEAIELKTIAGLNKKKQVLQQQFNQAISQEQREAIKKQIDEIDKQIKKMQGVDVSGKSGKGGGKSGKKAKPIKDKDDKQKEYQEALNLQQQYNNDSEKLEERLEEEKLKIQEDSLEKELKMQEASRAKEFQSLREQSDKIYQNIYSLQEKIKQAKTPQAKSVFEKALEREMDVLQTHDKLVEQSEQTHQYKMAQIREKWAMKDIEDFVKSENVRIEKERAADEEEISNIKTMAEAKAKLSKLEYLTLTDTELEGIRTLEDAKRALREEADRKMLDAQLKSLEAQREILTEELSKMTGPAAKKLKEDLNQLNIRIVKIKSAIQGGKEQDQAKVDNERQEQLKGIDILGFSAADWQDLFDNLDTTEGKIKAAVAAMQAMANAASMFGKLQAAINQREMHSFTKNQDKKKKALLKLLNEGKINQEQYHKRLQELEVQSANKKAEISYKEAKAQKAADIMSAISGTATAVIGALGNKPWTPANFVLAGIVGALGAVQIGTIAAQPLPEKPSFAQGGYTGNGIGAADATGHRPAGIVHEGEYVTPKWMLQIPMVADTVSWMESIRTGRTKVKGYAEGGYTEPQKETNRTTTDDSTYLQMIGVMTDVKNLLTQLNENGVDAYMVEDAENGRRLKRTIKEFEKIEQRNARKNIN
ncbi:coiled-coil domain-containing protein [Riemerella columbipharyngis]|uniref:Phage tail tape measure protein, TP901 family, core region n=1 Tax=Riemerella columbipharyngis TaxID=1071918 RepID=A0A1G7E0A2_9FLAO|nr:hypothetical protein [Riemerella columbipharyngis]SDE57129.1 hypothetical protein SAMN05421544_11357 [Riemerella columbipharyngis]